MLKTPLSRYICQEIWPTVEYERYYSIALMTFQFLIPLAVLISTYTRIAVAVWGKRPPGEAENSRDQRMARSKRKVSLILINQVVKFSSKHRKFVVNCEKKIDFETNVVTDTNYVYEYLIIETISYLSLSIQLKLFVCCQIITIFSS